MSAIAGLGIDLVDLRRIERLYARWGDTFVHRFCLPAEVQTRQGAALIAHLGGLFSAKEAVLKALGSGWSRGVGLLQVEVVRRSGGGPGVQLHRQAADWAARLGVCSIHLSITHDGAYAAAVAVLERESS